MHSADNCHVTAQGTGQLTEEGAELMAGMRAVIVGRGAPGTTIQECRRISPAFLADCNEVRPCSAVPVSAMLSPWSQTA